MNSPQERAAEIVGECRGRGFALAGVCDAGPSRWGDELRAWLAAGRHGSMEYLARNVEPRVAPASLLPGARSVVVVGDLYAEGRFAASSAPPRETVSSASASTENRPAGRIARYARGRDYHTVIKKRLHGLCDALRERYPDAAFRAFTDTAPVMERELAARAGLGWIGKHTLVIHPRLGSWMLLGGFLTTLALEPPAEQKPVADHCGTCTRCIDACPTRAITPYSVDASRCISYLTIERRAEIAEEFHGPMGDWLFGCDVCQEVCPHNGEKRRSDGVTKRRSEDESGVRPEYAPRRESFDLLDVLGWSEEDRRREFASSAMKRATLAMMKRNALIVLGNVLMRNPDAGFAARVAEVASDPKEPELVRRTAESVLRRLARAGAAG